MWYVGIKSSILCPWQTSLMGHSTLGGQPRFGFLAQPSRQLLVINGKWYRSWNLFAIAAIGLVWDSLKSPLSNSGIVAKVLSQPILELACFWTLSSTVWRGSWELPNLWAEDLDLTDGATVTWSSGICPNSSLPFFNVDSPQAGWACCWPQSYVSPHTFSLCFTLPWVLSPLLSPSFFFSILNSSSNSTPSVKPSHTIATGRDICSSWALHTWRYAGLYVSSIYLTFLPSNYQLSEDRNYTFYSPHLFPQCQSHNTVLWIELVSLSPFYNWGNRGNQQGKNLAHSHSVTKREKC